jgi:hypothetical protein
MSWICDHGRAPGYRYNGARYVTAVRTLAKAVAKINYVVRSHPILIMAVTQSSGRNSRHEVMFLIDRVS